MEPNDPKCARRKRKLASLERGSNKKAMDKGISTHEHFYIRFRLYKKF